MSQHYLPFILKKKFFSLALVFSLALNVVGIAFAFLYVKEHARHQALRKEKASLEKNLGFSTHGKRIIQILGSGVIGKYSFNSHLDGKQDFYAFQAPVDLDESKSLNYTLLVYLHGMGSTYLEPFVALPGRTEALAVDLLKDNPRLAILSCSYRKEASWGNPSATSDIIQNIRQVMQSYPFKNIVLMGTSMGGCVALNLAATAPEDIKSIISGVVSMEAAGDLKAVWERTGDKLVSSAIETALGGTPDQVPEAYKKHSFIANIEGLPKTVKVYLLSSKSDKVIPPALQLAIVNALSQRSITYRLVEVEGEHQIPEAKYYADGYKFVLGTLPAVGR